MHVSPFLRFCFSAAQAFSPSVVSLRMSKSASLFFHGLSIEENFHGAITEAICGIKDASDSFYYSGVSNRCVERELARACHFVASARSADGNTSLSGSGTRQPGR